MKRLWIAALLLAALFGATLCNNLYLRGFTGALNTLLEQAEARAETGDWEEAHVLTEQALTQWQSRDSYLHILLRHSDTDQIYTGFQEVLEVLTCQCIINMPGGRGVLRRQRPAHDPDLPALRGRTVYPEERPLAPVDGPGKTRYNGG